jgi:hypothetical protein
MGTRDADNFFTWTKFLNGWIEDSEVACIVNQESFKVYLTESDLNKNKKKLLLIQDGPGKMIAAELRTPSVCYLDNNCFGLLLYNINTNIDHGAGPITVKRSVVSPGYSAIYSNYEFSVIDYDSRGILVSVKKYV